MISLISSFEVTKKYSGQSKFDFWKSLEVGDIVHIQIAMVRPRNGYKKRPNDTDQAGPVRPTISKEGSDDTFSSAFPSFVKYLGKVGLKHYKEPCSCQAS